MKLLIQVGKPMTIIVSFCVAFSGISVINLGNLQRESVCVTMILSRRVKEAHETLCYRSGAEGPSGGVTEPINWPRVCVEEAICFQCGIWRRSVRLES